MRAARGIGEVVVAGSYRRRKETVGDLDILVTARDGGRVIDHFVVYEEVDRGAVQGDHPVDRYSQGGIQVDLRVVPRGELRRGASLFHRLQGPQHRRPQARHGQGAEDQRVRRLSRRRSASPDGPRKRSTARSGCPISSRSCARTAARSTPPQPAPLPKLVALDDIRGDLHAHTRATDGKSTLARDGRGGEGRAATSYLAITDHSKHATVAHGLDAKRLAAELDDIDRLNDELEGITLVKSCEVDILADGKLDLPDSILKRLDFTVCAVHYRFDLDRDKQTERIIRAMDNRYFTILAHPTGASSASGRATPSTSSG